MKFITISDFEWRWDAGSHRTYVYWNPEPEARFEHPAVSWQPESVDYYASQVPIVLLRTRRAVVIVAGCRRLRFDEASDHWRGRIASYHPEDAKRARWWIAYLPKLKRRARRLGWL